MKTMILCKYFVWALFSASQQAAGSTSWHSCQVHTAPSISGSSQEKSWNKLGRSGRAGQLHSFQPKPFHDSLRSAGTSHLPTSHEFIGSYFPVSNTSILPLGTLAGMQLVNYLEDFKTQEAATTKWNLEEKASYQTKMQQ